jgi:pyruvate kinase
MSKDFRRTKIIATVGPSTDSYEAIAALINAGVNCFRLNCSHGTNEERTRQIKWIRKASCELGVTVAIAQDLQGPKMRLGDFDGIVNVSKGQELSFAFEADYSKTGHLPVQHDISKKVKRGENLYIYDGKIRTVITSVRGDIVHARAENDGILIKHKGINLPDTDFGDEVITAKDRMDLVYGSAQDIDYVGLSFVRSAADIHSLRKLLNTVNSSAKIIAKIETKAAIHNLEDIVCASDAIMIARGDLAVEVPAESVPLIQRQIVSLGIKYSRPTIVATQMLASMVDATEPTRAEVSDVATGVIMAADCLMLSDETAIGSHAVESVKTMCKIINYTEGHSPRFETDVSSRADSAAQEAISLAIITLAESIDAKAIVAETRSGATALAIAAHRPQIPIIAVTNYERTAQQQAITYGVNSYVRPADSQAALKLTKWLQGRKILHKGDMVVTASGEHPGVVGTTDTIKVRMIE